MGVEPPVAAPTNEIDIATTASRIRGTPSSTALPGGDEIINRSELARRLACSERQVDFLVRSRRITVIRLGTKSVRFLWSRVLSDLAVGAAKGVA